MIIAQTGRYLDGSPRDGLRGNNRQGLPCPADRSLRVRHGRPSQIPGGGREHANGKSRSGRHVCLFRGPGSLGAIQAIKARGFRKVKLITFDFSDAHVEALEDGTIDKMIVQDPYRIGYEAVRSLADHLAGGKSVKRLDLPARVVVKADLAKPEIRALVSPAWMKK